MKQGSTDDPFAEEPDTGETSEDDGDSEDGAPDADGPDSGGPDDGAAAAERSATELRGTGESAGPAADESAARTRSEDRTGSGGQGLASRESTGQRGSLPYIHARDGVKDGRTQRPVFLRDHVEAGIDDLVAEMEAELGEDVYKTDVTEAAMAVAQENPDLVLAKLEEWGYGWT